jgi:hypothetical protein
MKASHKETSMKKLILIPLALAGLSVLGGCAVYPDGYAYNNGYYNNGYYANGGYYYGNGGYYYGPSAAVTIESRPAYGYYRRDRDGDGVPNRWDRRPNNPYRW